MKGVYIAIIISLSVLFVCLIVHCIKKALINRMLKVIAIDILRTVEAQKINPFPEYDYDKENNQ